MISTVTSKPSLPPANCTQIQARNGNAVAITTGSELMQAITTPTPSPQNNTLGSRIIPKIGAIVKRFSLNYSGEGLVTDPQRVRTVRVGIRFQVQVDSFLNNSNTSTLISAPTGPLQLRPPRAIIRTNSAPHSIDYISTADCDSSYNTHHAHSTSEITDTVAVAPNSNNNRQFVIGGGAGGSPTLHRKFTSVGNLNKENPLTCSDIDLDSSSGVSSLGGSNPQSPVSTRRHSSSIAFHNRINQALSLCRNQLSVRGDIDRSGRRNSVQVYRRESSSSLTPERSPISTSPLKSAVAMEDSSSYQVLRFFPGSNINSAREFSWETAVFEKDVREKVQWLGAKFSSLRVPPFVQNILASLKSYAKENPLTAIFMLAAFVASVLPISIFLGFAIATILVSVIGFLFVEGTLLTVAGITFGGVIVVVGLVAIFFALLGSAGYFTTSKIYSFLTGKDLKDLFRYLPLIGTFFDKEDEENNSLPGSSLSSPKATMNGFKPSNGFTTPMKILPYSDEEDEDEDEGNVEVVDVDSENETDKEDGNASIASDSDVGIADTTCIENVDYDLDLPPQPEVKAVPVNLSPPTPPPPPLTNGYYEEETHSVEIENVAQ